MICQIKLVHQKAHALGINPAARSYDAGPDFNDEPQRLST